MPQPKHLKVFRMGETLNEGVFSWWNGQRAVRFEPERRRLRKSETTSSMRADSRMRRVVDEGIMVSAEFGKEK